MFSFTLFAVGQIKKIYETDLRLTGKHICMRTQVDINKDL